MYQILTVDLNGGMNDKTQLSSRYFKVKIGG